MDRRQRLKALGLERVVILDRGNVELAVPPGWTVEHDPAGHLTCKDPTDSCKLEISYFTLPPHSPDAPSVSERLGLALGGDVDQATRTPAVTLRRGAVEMAWTDYVFTSDDTERGERREAHGRLLLAANRWFHAVFTFSYWTDDAGGRSRPGSASSRPSTSGTASRSRPRRTTGRSGTPTSRRGGRPRAHGGAGPATSN